VGGELYAVDWRALPDLDAFEGCPRLYQRHWLPLADGRQAWAYLGQARQVRHSRHLPGGLWPLAGSPRPGDRSAWSGGARRWVNAAALLLSLSGGGAMRAGGLDMVGLCQAWRHSRGPARVELANAIGVAHFLTKRHPFVESPAAQPVELYAPGDIRRVCGERGS
jgi:hypothetical protein